MLSPPGSQSKTSTTPATTTSSARRGKENGSDMSASGGGSHSNVVVFEQTINVDEDVTDFFDHHFASRQDLSNVKTVLKEQQQVHHDLMKTFKESKTKTTRILQQMQIASQGSIENLQRLEGSVMDLEEQAEKSENFAFGTGFKGQRSMMDELLELKTKVQGLEDARQYLVLLSRTQDLVDLAKKQLSVSTEKALIPYEALLLLLSNVKKVSMISGEEGMKRNEKLIEFMQSSADMLLREFKAQLSKKLEQAMTGLGWPTPIANLQSVARDKLDAFESAFLKMLLLQRPTYGTPERQDDKPFPPLLPLEILLEPLIIRFRFHFEGKRPTNRIDKPEWYLTHILGVVKDHGPFLEHFVQGIVHGTDFKEYDVKNDFIRILLLAVERKIRSTVPDMLASPELLSHVISETVLFDKTLRETEFYSPPGQVSDWKGCVQVYLGHRTWLKAWLRGEREFALARYEQIMQESDAWELAYDDLQESDMIMPTKSAEKLMDLLEIITERYRGLAVLEHQTFLLDIQLEILIEYHRNIRTLVDNFESMTYSFVRVLPGAASTDELGTMGTEGLKKLCRWLVSAEYIINSLRDWGEDVFFLEMFAEINEKLSNIKNPLHSDNEVSSDEERDEQRRGRGGPVQEGGTIFDDSIKAYQKLSKRIQEMIVKNVTKEVYGGMKPYVSLRSWPQIEMSSLDDGGRSPHHDTPQPRSQDSDDISPELYMSLSVLTHSFTFLASTLPTRHFTSLYKDISLDLQTFLWQKVIMKNQFSELGGLQLARDIRNGFWECGRRWIKKPENYQRRLKDASILLSLPSTKANSPPPQPSAGDKNGTGALAKRTLSQIMAVLFDEDMEQAAIQRKLEEAGITHLSVQESKEVIRRRVECWR